MDPLLPWLLIAAPSMGSFLGTLALRLPAGEPVAVARSRCPACGHALGATELVPLLSWIAQRGRCRHCDSPIAAFYPGMELAALGVAAWAASETAGSVLLVTCVLGWTLLVLAVIDRRCFLLPDVLTLPLLGAGLIVTLWLDPMALGTHALAAAGCWAGFAALGLSYRWLRGRDGLGLGDAKLLAAGAAWIGAEAIPVALLIACALGLAEVMVLRLRTGQWPGGSEPIAFGGWLACGIWLVWLYGAPLFG